MFQPLNSSHEGWPAAHWQLDQPAPQVSPKSLAKQSAAVARLASNNTEQWRFSNTDLSLYLTSPCLSRQGMLNRMCEGLACRIVFSVPLQCVPCLKAKGCSVSTLAAGVRGSLKPSHWARRQELVVDAQVAHIMPQRSHQHPEDRHLTTGSAARRVLRWPEGNPFGPSQHLGGHRH